MNICKKELLILDFNLSLLLRLQGVKPPSEPPVMALLYSKDNEDDADEEDEGKKKKQGKKRQLDSSSGDKPKVSVILYLILITSFY